MRLAVHGLVAGLGWTALMLLSYAPGPVPTVALIIALALLVGCVASLLHTAGGPPRAVPTRRVQPPHTAHHAAGSDRRSALFSVGRRPASIYVVLGGGSAAPHALSRLNEFIASLEFARDPEATDFRKPPLEAG